MKVHVGDYELLDSGVISNVNDAPIILELDPKIIVKLFFETNPSENRSLIKSVLNPEKVLEYTLTNFNNPLGTEFTQMAEMGIYNGRKLYFHVKVLGNTNAKNKTVIYSFYLGGVATNGKE